MRTIITLMVAVAAIATVVLVAKPAEAITCGEVESQLAPCMPYLVGGGNPKGACCGGVKKLDAMTVNTADKQVVCNCAKQAANQHQEIKEDLMSGLAKKCGVDSTVPISKTVDCAKIQ